MTNASAMMLTLLLFGALMVSAVLIILWGGGLSLRHREPRLRRRHMDAEQRHMDAEHRKAA
jgi:hypothetical protein